MVRADSIYAKPAQDAREGGENPSLPRNCERTCLVIRRFGAGRNASQSFSRGNREAVDH